MSVKISRCYYGESVGILWMLADLISTIQRLKQQYIYERHQKKKWTREDNKNVIYCYFKSNNTQSGNKKKTWSKCGQNPQNLGFFV